MPTTPRDTPATPEAGAARDAYAPLAQANLLRMRGCWDEAVAICMTVLQAGPENASAHSLLGDIYENQGRTDEAIQWYRMALDLNPDSPADALKLNRLLRAKSELAAPADSVRLAAESSLQKTFWGLRAPERLVRTGAYTAALLLLLIVALAVLASVRHPGRSAADQSHQISAPPVLIGPAVGSPPSPAVGGSEGTKDTAAAATASSAHDPGEQSLLGTLRGAPELSGHTVSVADVQYDPRSHRLTLTLICGTQNGSSVRDQILRASLGALQAAVRLTDGQSVSNFTVRALLGTADDGTPLVFVGDISRANIPAASPDQAGLTGPQIEAAYALPWWSPSLSA